MDFTSSEVAAIEQVINERWKDETIPTHLADLEIVKEEGLEDKSYPAVVWEASNSTFIIVKTGAFSYQSFFYYAKEEQRYDTGINQYQDLHECASNLLKAQANFMLNKGAQKLAVDLNQ